MIAGVAIILKPLETGKLHHWLCMMNIAAIKYPRFIVNVWLDYIIRLCWTHIHKYKPIVSTDTNSLLWRHNGRDGVSNHQPHDCLLNCLFRRRSKKTPKLRVTGLCVGNSPGTGEFPAQMASNAENVSISWRHHITAELGKHKLITLGMHRLLIKYPTTEVLLFIVTIYSVRADWRLTRLPLDPVNVRHDT